jgi:hypothetical protein
MTETAAQDQYELVFHGYAIGPAGVEAKCGGKRMSNMLFGKGCKISIHAIGPDQSKSSITSIEIDFKARDGAPPSPLGDGKNPHYVWHLGSRPMTIGQTEGAWTFTSTLVDNNGKHYTLPDPEFQVGDGARSAL